MCHKEKTRENKVIVSMMARSCFFFFFVVLSLFISEGDGKVYLVKTKDVLGTRENTEKETKDTGAGNR